MSSTPANTSQRADAAASAAGGVVGEVVLSPRAAWGWAAVWALLFVATFWDFFRQQVSMATTQVQDWGHTLLIPVIACYFVYVKRDRVFASAFRPSVGALALVLIGVVVYSAAAFGPPSLQHHNLRGAGVGIALLGSLLTVFGVSSIRWIWFPWAYWVVFGQYISERAMSRVTGNVLTVHMSDGTVHPLNVAEACSGMRTLMAFLAIGVALAALGLPRWWQRVLLVLAGVPISIFVNVLRVASLGLLSMVDANFSTGEFHSMVGLVWLVPAFLLFLGAMWLIRNLVVEVEPSAAGGAP